MGSWCPPCIVEFKKGANFRKKMEREQNVNFLYFAIDEDQKTWIQKLPTLKSYISLEHQYLIVNSETSKLLKHLLIRENSGKTYFSIPRYTILDSEKRIKSNNAPRPSDSLVFEKLIKEMQRNK